MKRMTFIFLLMAALAIIIVSCAEKLPTRPTVPPLSLTACAVPDSIPLTYALGLYMVPDGGVPPYKTEWKYGNQVVSEKLATTFKPSTVGKYTFWAFAKDAAGVIESTMVSVQCVPLDSIHLPPDTVVLPPDTIRIELPPIHDTTIVIITRHDTTFVPVVVHDTIYLPGDTIWQWHCDTLMVHDTIVRVDSIFVPVIVHDTVMVYVQLPPDTVYVPVVDTLVDTLYLPADVIQDTACYKIDYQNLEATVLLHNKAGWYRVIGFDWLRKDPPPTGKGFYIIAGGQTLGFAVTGESYQIAWVGDQGVYLEENATIVIKLAGLVYLPKTSNTSCYQYLEGCYWWLIPMDK